MTVEKLIELLNEAEVYEGTNYFAVYRGEQVKAGMDGTWDLTKLAKAITESEEKP